ncbi:ABC transporter ATP-binding protein [Streptomyces cyaneofuscatus]|uniref:ABC transporter ATP-binding protein n=1 Tax=Streptomyces TaxID=1883 RepID=UPI000365BAFD|nr:MULTISPECIES: ABC transporter ATP-binding protein [unclassified Streptomyces]MZF55406.1 ATP-binding cassette domain-containing protein [Streptomyces sp. SID5594]
MLIRLLRTYLRPHLRPLGLLGLFQLLQTLATLYLPTLNARLIDDGVVKGDTGYVLAVGGLMVAVVLVQILSAAAAVHFGAKVATALGRDVRVAIFERVQGLSVREVGRFGAPSLITRTTNDVQQVQMVLLVGFTLALPAPFMAAVGIAMALSLDATLSWLLLVVVPLLVVVVAVILLRMAPLSRDMQERIDQVNRVVREQITGIRVIRAFVRDAHEQGRFARANTELMQVSLGAARINALMLPSIMLILNGANIAVLWFGGHRIDSGSLQVGALIAFLQYLLLILQAAIMATYMLMIMPRAEVSAGRIREVLGTESSVSVAASPVTTLREPGHLDVHDVEFRYPGAQEPVLRGVHLSARPGETTAVVGSTGSGKTTLVNLVARLFDATGGSVRVGGSDVRELDPALLPSTVGLVPQTPYLFSGTVASNLRYGNPDADDAELWRALEIAQARQFVEAMPGRLDAPISQGGGNVSGGQRQRLAIARALVARPDIYLFDDSFSALDYATDAALRAALARETEDAAVVIVAQRVATIRDADRIVVLDEGRVVGTGTHTELMERNETYREIVLSQLTEEEAA